MLRNAIHHFIRPRHPWRKINFDELAEIYVSMSIRSFGLGVIGIFVPIYLYQNGVALPEIFLFFALFFTFRIPLAYISAFIVGRVGPKHGLAISTLVLVVFLLQLLTYTSVWWPLAFLAFTFSLSNALFFISYHTDFSKVADHENSGKELGWLFIFERIGGALGPVVGGLMGSYFSPAWTIVFAICLLAGSLIPLFMTNEQVAVHQKINFKGFNWRAHIRDFISLGAFAVDTFGTIMLWPLFMGLYIFTDDTYAKLGGIVGLSMIISILVARKFGRIIDSKGGLKLLKYGTILNAATHIVRSFIATPSGALTVSLVNEPTTLSYRMPLTKGYYDAVDSEEGYRIVFITLAEIVTAVPKLLFCFGLFFACSFFDPMTVLRSSFMVVGVLSSGILLQRFPALTRLSR